MGFFIPHIGGKSIKIFRVALCEMQDLALLQLGDPHY